MGSRTNGGIKMEEKAESIIFRLNDKINDILNSFVRGMANKYVQKQADKKLPYSYGGKRNDLDLSILEPGDILEFYPMDPPELVGLCNSLEKILLHPWGHHWGGCNMYVGDGKLVHGYFPACREEPYEVIHTATDAAVYRVKTTDDIKKRAVEWIKTKVGVPYNYDWILLIPLCYPMCKHVEGNAYYCSEIVWAAYKQAGIDLNPYPGFYTGRHLQGYAISPQGIADSDKVELVAYAGSLEI
jgi:uncharacterized protein YycO